MADRVARADEIATYSEELKGIFIQKLVVALAGFLAGCYITLVAMGIFGVALTKHNEYNQVLYYSDIFGRAITVRK